MVLLEMASTVHSLLLLIPAYNEEQRIGPVLRGFDPPSTRYGAGHRGVDLAAPLDV